MNAILSAALLCILWCVAETTSELQDVGPFFQCAHDLRGRVWAINERELLITDFYYDGNGPGAWFHGQLRPAPEGRLQLKLGCK